VVPDPYSIRRGTITAIHPTRSITSFIVTYAMLLLMLMLLMMILMLMILLMLSMTVPYCHQ